MSTAAIPSSTPASDRSTSAESSGADFEQRWTAWKTRGRVHERAVRQRFLVAAIVAGTIALGTVIVYALLSS